MFEKLVWGVVLALACFRPAMGTENKVKKVAVVYGSRYGSTAQTAEWIAQGIGEGARVIDVEKIEDLGQVDHVVLGSGIYGGKITTKLQAFIDANKEILKQKVIGVFVVCGAKGPHAKNYASSLAAQFEKPINLKQHFGGWQKKKLLSEKDLKLLEGYYQKINKPFRDYDHTEKDKSILFGKQIKKALGNLQSDKT